MGIIFMGIVIYRDNYIRQLIQSVSFRHVSVLVQNFIIYGSLLRKQVFLETGTCGNPNKTESCLSVPFDKVDLPRTWH